jgi:hypothetical protein
MRAHERRVFVLCCLASACSSARASSIRALEGGRYQLECEASLRECLAQAEARCDISGYRVLDAAEAKHRVGVPPLQSEYNDSRAIFVCGAGERKAEVTPERATSCPSQSSPALLDRCLPGASRACVGPGGCSGGQSCLPDGKSLSACDCGPPAAAPQRPVAPPE